MCMTIGKNAARNALRMRNKGGVFKAYKVFAIPRGYEGGQSLLSPYRETKWRIGKNKSTREDVLLYDYEFDNIEIGFHIYKDFKSALCVKRDIYNWDRKLVIIPVYVDRKDVVASGLWKSFGCSANCYVVTKLTVKKEDYKKALSTKGKGEKRCG